MSLLWQSITGLVPLDQSVLVLAPTLSANPHLPGEQSIDWGTVTVAETVRGRLAPVSSKALERVGRVGAVGVVELLAEPVALTPLGRVRIGGRDYSVLDVRSYPQRTLAVLEEVSA